MKTIVEILIDNSSSMGLAKEYLLSDGSTRMNLAKKVLVEELIPTLANASTIYVWKFHSVQDKGKAEKLVINPIYETTLDIKNLSEIVQNIADPGKTGGTPITAAINFSIENLRKFPECDRKIILITDGEETGNGNYHEAANKALEMYGIDCNIFVVGIAQNERAKERAKQLAKDTGGEYINLKVAKYNKAKIRSKLSSFKSKFYQKSIANADQFITRKTSAITTTPVLKTDSVLITNQKTQNTQVEEKINPSPANPLVENNGSTQNKPQEVKQIPTESAFLAEIENKFNNHLADVEETVQSNSSQLVAVSSQIDIVIDEIKALKNGYVEFEEGEKVTIKENKKEQERVGRKSEAFVNKILVAKYGSRLVWLNENGESNADHDFEVKDTDDSGKPIEVVAHNIECKGTKFDNNRFYLTKDEWNLFLNRPKNYQIYFVKNIDQKPVVTKIDNLLDWILRGEIVPYSTEDITMQKERIVLTIMPIKK